MKIYFLKSKTAVYCVSDVMVTKEFFIVPVHNSNCFDVYARDVFQLSVEETQETEVGFKK